MASFKRFIDMIGRAIAARRARKTRDSGQPAEQAPAERKQVERDIAKEFRDRIDAQRADRGKAADDYDDIELIGDRRPTPEQFERAEQGMRLVESSNVYGYYFQPDTQKVGTLFVQFLYWEPGMKSEERSGPGPIYAYYAVPVAKYREFERAAAGSAGGAVWDYLRVRGTRWDHQHGYSLVDSVGYVPRKATRKGLSARSVLDPRQSIEERKTLPFARGNTLPATHGRKFPNRGRPDNGRADNGRRRPNRGR